MFAGATGSDEVIPEQPGPPPHVTGVFTGGETRRGGQESEGGLRAPPGGWGRPDGAPWSLRRERGLPTPPPPPGFGPAAPRAVRMSSCCFTSCGVWSLVTEAPGSGAFRNSTRETAFLKRKLVTVVSRHGGNTRRERKIGGRFFTIYLFKKSQECITHSEMSINEGPCRASRLLLV